MNGMTLGLLTTACVFAGTLLGLQLRRFLPEQHLRDDSKEAVKVAGGMISLMAALVLGLLVSSAKNKFDSATAAMIDSGARVILLDRAMADYGPETQSLRKFLRDSVAYTRSCSGRRRASLRRR